MPNHDFNATGRFRDRVRTQDQVCTIFGTDEHNAHAQPDGTYGDVVTETCPHVMACFKGTPDESFRKRPP